MKGYPIFNTLKLRLRALNIDSFKAAVVGLLSILTVIAALVVLVSRSLNGDTVAFWVLVSIAIGVLAYYGIVIKLIQGKGKKDEHSDT